MTTPAPNPEGENQIRIATQLTIDAREEKAVALPESHYARIQSKIRKSVGVTSASLWLTGALTFLGAALGGLITLLSIPVQDTPAAQAARGQVEIALYACLALTFLCAFGHVSWYRSQRGIGDDICDEMDTYSHGTPIRR